MQTMKNKLHDNIYFEICVTYFCMRTFTNVIDKDEEKYSQTQYKNTLCI